MEWRHLLSAIVVTNTNDDTNPNSLRWAILQANSSQSASEIQFDIAESGAVKIRLGSPLPAIEVPVSIDGTTEPGYEGSPLVEIDGSDLTGGGNDGLVIAAGGSTVCGLALVGFSGSAIVLSNGNENAVSGNYLGVDPTGAVALPNQVGLTLQGSSGNTIGVGPAGIGNVISGNSGDGILIESGINGSVANMIDGNRIGTAADGSDALANGGAGIEIDGAGENTIGGLGQGFGNVISGNAGPGIRVTALADATVIQNNEIGVAADGTTPLGNKGDGIDLDDAPGTLIGGAGPGEGNVISENHLNGIDTAGETAGLWIAGNAIGTDVTGQLVLGNDQNGINLASGSNSIGGTIAGAANVIEFNGSGKVGAGVQLVGQVDQNTILSNSIYQNAGLGINFGSGPTPNHAPGTPGPNDYQNYPTLSSAQSDGSSTKVTGTLFESPNSSYFIQFFSSPRPDLSGYGQGKVLLGAASVQTNAQGTATFTESLSPVSQAGTYISATATDSSGDTSEFSATVAIQGQINLVLTGTATPDPVLAGGTVTYSLTVANHGLAEADGVLLNDQLPAGVSVVSVGTTQGFGVPQMTQGAVSVFLGTLQAGSSATVTIQVQTSASSSGTIVDKASVTSQETDSDSATESISISDYVQTTADVAVALEGPTDALAGGDLTYTMTVENNGPGGASGVDVDLPVPTGLSFVSVTSGAGSATFAGGQVVADLGDLTAGAKVVVTAILQATAAGSYTETATVSSLSFDPDASNNTSSITTVVAPACDLVVKVSADTGVAATGIPFDYTVTLTNNGPSDATGVVLSDTLPAGVTYVGESDDQDLALTVSGGVVSLALDTLAAGDSATFVIAVDPTAAAGSTLVDSATATGQQADPKTANNTATLSTPVRGVSDLSVQASVRSGSAYIGQPLTYTISVTNLGPATEPDAVLGCNLPAGLLVASTRSTQGGDPPVEQGILTADLGSLAPGATAVVTLVAAPSAKDLGSLTTGFSVQGLDYDPDLSDNTAYATTTVVATTDLGVSIAPSDVPAMAQLHWAYTVKVANSGPSAATGVIATIPLPAGVQFVSASASQGVAPAQQGSVLTAALGDIASGASATVTIVIDPGPSSSGITIPLAARVAGGEYDPNSSNNQASLNLAVAPSVDLALEMSSTPQVVPSGQSVSFTATVSNLGPSTATGVVVSFPTMSGLSSLSWTPSQGAMAQVSGQYLVQLGNLGPGAAATVTMYGMATSPGTLTQAASVSEDQYNLDQPGATASASAQVVESAGTVEFGAASYEVTDQSGVAVISVVRLYGASGTITVPYQTIAVNATPGVDFTPTSGTLTLGPGQASATIQVPVLDDPWQNHDDYVNVTFGDPAGGAWLGPIATTLLHIQDVDPDVTAPVVTGLALAGSSHAITSLTLSFSAPLDPAYASDPANYHLNTTANGKAVSIASISYDPATFSVTIVPQSPLPARKYVQIQVVGTGPDAIRDLAGNILDGDGDGAAGSNYLASFAQGNLLKYKDSSGSTVTLQLGGPGYLEQVRDASGNGVSLKLVGMVPHRTTLKGHIKVKHRHGGGGEAELGTITGLGQFGDVKVLLKTPPFQVAQLPFQRRGRFVL